MKLAMQNELSDLLRAVADDLDLPSHLHEDAVVKYSQVGEWLAQEDSELAKFEPDIFPQGSFRLGTMVRPINDSDEYDIDLVCLLKFKKENTTQKELKERVGKRLEAEPDLKKILKPSRRCWVLDYPEPFHLDVLPVIPNVERLPNGILLTDTELHHWQHGNPIDYAEWFKEQMKVVLTEKVAAYAEQYQMSIEDVPEYEVKTPLQRVVQILKRHRDIYFKNDLVNRPVSIIITTLAARAYRNESDLYDALINVSAKMLEYIEKRDDKWWVENPVDAHENFADKWNEYSERSDAFFRWLERVRDDFVTAAQQRTMTKSAAVLMEALGQDEVSRAAQSLGVPNSLIPKPVTPSVPALGSTTHCVPPIWPMQLLYKVSIKATVHPASRSSKVKWPLTHRPVPRNVWLQFEAQTNVSKPYDVRWQVVNTGRDAETAGALRGDLFENCNGPTGNVRWEETAYRGTHWVEAFVIQHGECVARSSPFKVRIR